MKKINLKAICVLVAGGLMLSSCIGSFGLFNKYEKWQCNMTGNKYVNGIVGLILQPIVAPFCGLADALVLNTIEFWSGKNPVQANVQKVKGSDGNLYAIKTTKTGYEITSPAGEVIIFTHNEKDNSWSISQKGLTQELFRYNEDGTIEAQLPNGQVLSVTNDAKGLLQVQEALAPMSYYAMT